MEKIAIITDSCGDIPNHWIDKYNIYVIPVLVQCGDREYKDGIDINVNDVYEMQKREVLKTASPAGGDILKTLEMVKEDGYTHAIAVMLSGGLSGTVNQVRLLAESIDDLEVEVFNSMSASIGCGVITMTLSEYRDQGFSFNKLVEKARSLIADTYVFFSIDTLEFLQKGGRIGKASAFVGSALKIKPILSFDKSEGSIDVSSKVRGSKKVPLKLIELVSKIVESHPDQTFRLMVADGNLKEERNQLKLELLKVFPQCKDVIEADIGAALSCYLGPGLLGAGIQFIDN